MDTITSHTKSQRPFGPGGRLDPGKLHYSPRWLVAAAVGAAGAALAGVSFGAPALALGAGLAAAAYGHMRFIEPRRPEFVQVTLRVPQLPAALDGLRIGQISDMHLGFAYTAANTRWAVQQMMQHAPDLVAVTGDVVHYSSALPQLPNVLQGLRAPLGVWAVPGNHDYWEGLAEVQHMLGVAGVTLLMNEHRVLTHNGAAFVLAGIDDAWEGEMDLDATLGSAPSLFTLMLSHVPDTADAISARGPAVQLSGHTHGGHLRLPLLGHALAPRYGTRYIIGQHQVGPMQLYVSRGIGGAPLRLLCRPEATLITLRQA